MLSPRLKAVSLGLVGAICVATTWLVTYKSFFALPLALIVHYHHPIPFSAITIEDLGFVTDPVLNEGGIYHDGGGGATQNGYHVQIFADSATNSSGFNFVHNSVSYFGYREPGNPLNQYQFGMTGPKGAEGRSIFSGIVPVGPEGNETEVGPIFAVWMLSAMTPMPDGQTILGVFPCLNEGNSTNFYNTMVQMNVTDPETVPPGGNPPFQRLGNGRLFYVNEPYYGTFALETKPDGYLYLYAADKTGIKMARTPIGPDSIADRNQYAYFNSAIKRWQKEPLTKNDATGNIINWSVPGPKDGAPVGPNVGDVWYDHYFKTTVMMWNSAGIDATFWFSYAMSNNLEGPWSEPIAVWTPPIPYECFLCCPELNFNYQGHAHPGWDPTGKTLLVSYASCANYVSMARITWA